MPRSTRISPISLPLARWCSSASVELLGGDQAARDHHFADAWHAARPIEPQRLGRRCTLARVESPGHGASSVIAVEGRRHLSFGMRRRVLSAAAQSRRFRAPRRGAEARRLGGDAPSARPDEPLRTLGLSCEPRAASRREPGEREPVPAAASPLKATADFYLGRLRSLIERRLPSPCGDRGPMRARMPTTAKYTNSSAQQHATP